MKIKSNKISDIKSYIKQELEGVYNVREIESFIYCLFEEYTGMSRTDLVLKSEMEVNESVLLKFHIATKELKKSKPVQYILGKAYFENIELYVNEYVLIPRQETEELTRWIKDDHSNEINKKLKIIDIGTGSGCIALALKMFFSRSTVYGIDISQDALEVAERNSKKLNLNINLAKINILHSNEWGDLPLFDIIVSNPPYIRMFEKEFIKSNVLNYEPHISLFVENNSPLLFYEQIAHFAKRHLNENGKVYFEINENLSKATMDKLKDIGFLNIMLKKDINGKDRCVCCSL